MEFLQDQENYPITNEEIYKNTHLNSAIKIYSLLDCLGIEYEGKNLRPKQTKKITASWSSLATHVKDLTSNYEVEISKCIGQLFKIQLNFRGRDDINQELIKALSLARVRWNSEWEVVTNWSGQKQVPDLKLSHTLTEEIKGWFFLKAILERLIILTCSSRKTTWNGPGSDSIKIISEYSEKIFSHENEIFTIHANKEFFCIKFHSKKIQENIGGAWFVGVRDQLLMISDLASQRFSLILQSAIASSLKISNYLNSKQLRTIFSWGDNILQQIGNLGYKILKEWEALNVGVMLQKNPSEYFNTDTLLTRILKDIGEKEKEFNVNSKVQEMVVWLGELYDENPNLVSQSYGMFRIWGHPYLDIIGGLNALKLRGSKPRITNSFEIKNYLREWRKLFCMRYYEKEGKYPNFKELVENPLTKHLKKNLPVNINSKFYTDSYWDDLQFEETFKIPESIDLSDLIADKSMSLKHKDLIYSIQHKGNVGSGLEKSVLLGFLKENFVGARSFLKEIDANGFGPEEKWMGISGKEREMSVEGRFYGLLTVRKRLQVVLTEYLTGHFLFKYFPEITMLDDESVINKKRLKMTEHNSKSVRIFVSIDFEKWNGNMREEETKGLFRDMDHLFGLENVISRTHSMFKYLYLADNTFIPPLNKSKSDIEESLVSWSTHLGGIEGLRQKAWTIFSVVLILREAAKYPFKLLITAQGDNIVLACEFFRSRLTNEEIKLHFSSFLSGLNSKFQQIGPPLKMEETWVSDSLFIYGKYLLLNGTPMPLSMKKLCRGFRLSNEGFPTMGSSCSALTSNVMGAMTSSIDPYVPVGTHLIELQLCLLLHLNNTPLGKDGLIKSLRMEFGQVVCNFRIPKRSGDNRGSILIRKILDQSFFQDPSQTQKRVLNSLGILSLQYISSSLGGYPIMTIPALLTRGFPDPLTQDISILLKLEKIYSRNYAKLGEVINKILRPTYNPERNFSMIFEDPLSINTLKPSSPEERIKRSVTEFIKNYSESGVRNQYYLQFLRQAFTDRSRLNQILASMNPFEPRLISEILRATIEGVAYQFLQKLNKSGSVIKLMISDKYNNKLNIDSIYSSEISYLSSQLYKLSHLNRNLNQPISCSTTHSNKLRTESWGIKVEGVTVASPWECLKLVDNTGESCLTQSHPNPDKGYIILTPNVPVSFDSKGNSILGNSVPYFGSKTADKLSQQAKEFIRETPKFVSAALRLIPLIGWAVEKDTKLERFLIDLSKTFTNADLSFLVSEEGTISGSLEHRFQDLSTKKGGTNSLMINWGSCVTWSTDSFTAYSKGNQNVNLNFQPIFLLFQAIAACAGSLGEFQQSMVRHAHQDCPTCIVKINESKVDLTTEESWENLLTSMEGNPYCWLDKDDVMTPALNLLPKKILKNSDHFWSRYLKVNSSLTSLVTDFLMENVGFKPELSRFTSQTTQKVNISWVLKTRLDEVIISLWLKLGGVVLSKQQKLPTKLEFLESIKSEYLQSCEVLGHLLSTYCQIPGKMTELCVSDKLNQPGALLIGDIWTFSALTTFYKNIADPIYEAFTYNLIEIDDHFTLHPPYPPSRSELLIYSSYFLLQERNEEARLLHKYHKTLMKLDTFRNSQGIVDIKDSILNKFFPPGPLDLITRCYSRSIFTNIHPDTLSKFSNDPSSEIKRCLTLPTMYLLPTLSVIVASISSFTNLLGEEKEYLIDFKPEYPPIKQDQTFSEMRGTTGISSAPTKLLTILNYIDPIENAIVCGDGSGGFTFTVLNYFPTSKVHFNTITKGKGLIPHTINSMIPAYLLPYPELVTRLIRLQATRELSNDIGASTILPLFESICKEHNINTLICDAEGNSDNYYAELRILNNLLMIGNTLKISQMVIKGYYGGIEWLNCISSLCMNYYQKLTILRSYLSYENNSEIYMVLKNPKSVKGFSKLTENDNKIAISSVSLKIEINHDYQTISEADLTHLRDIPNWIERNRISNKLSRILSMIEGIVDLEDIQWDHILILFRKIFDFAKYRWEVHKLRRHQVLTRENIREIYDWIVVYLILKGAKVKEIIVFFMNHNLVYYLTTTSFGFNFLDLKANHVMSQDLFDLGKIEERFQKEEIRRIRSEWNSFQYLLRRKEKQNITIITQFNINLSVNNPKNKSLMRSLLGDIEGDGDYYTDF